MQTYIVLLKGINVGGHRKIPMAELRELLTKSGFENVQTYIQSGNVVLKSSQSASDIQDTIQRSILEHFGFDVAIIVKTREELQTIFNASPFLNEKKERSYFIMFNKILDRLLLKEVASISFENEEVVIITDALYFYSSVGYGNSKFNMTTYEKKLNIIGTARNYNTMLKLLSLSAD